MSLLFWTLTAFVFAFGAILGSFLNVVIHRLPRDQSVSDPPRSHCPSCEKPIAWYDNIPIASWLALGGKCRRCEAPIAARYALVEGLTGLLLVLLWFKTARQPFGAAVAAEALPWAEILIPFGVFVPFLLLLVVITFIDLEHYIIPHRLTLTGIVLGLISPWIIRMALPMEVALELWPPVSPLSSLIGVLVGGGVVLLIFVVFYAVRGVEGIGGGDVVLMAMVGAWLGWPALIFVFFAASLQGLAVAGVSMIFGFNTLKTLDEMYPDDAIGVRDGDLDERDAVAVFVAEPTLADAGDLDDDFDDEQATPSPQGETYDEVEEEHQEGGGGTVLTLKEEAPLALPFGPLIALAAVEHLLFGEMLSPSLSMIHLYDVLL